jgi:hypothetical protein
MKEIRQALALPLFFMAPHRHCFCELYPARGGSEMVTQNWPLLAKLLAIVAHQRLQQVHRAAFCLDGNEENLIIAIFGNDNYSADAKLQNEIDAYREQLTQTSNDELGFALSPDGATWVLLTRPRLERNRTMIAKVFQLEMLKSSLDDIVCGHRPAFAFPEQYESSRSAKECHSAK